MFAKMHYVGHSETFITYQDQLEGLLKPRLYESCCQSSVVKLDNLHFNMFPGDAGDFGPETTLWGVLNYVFHISISLISGYALNLLTCQFNWQIFAFIVSYKIMVL